ncbi:heparan sulfate glucosamine 3-O-sulfotransferase 3A1-like [Montipora foliosa]|uniref:heparan sulfate glucosamine 3-O-sulfotransferase 3A1-like n=1 Tax=Montipora foliosa TaxID=591990 RepID=UPI0035F16F13
MAAWLEGRKVCIGLLLIGLLSFYIYSVSLRGTKTQYEAAQFSKDDELLELDDNQYDSTSSDKFYLSGHFSRLATRRQKRLPNAIIIGVRKGGTRALLEFLKLHPKVKACSTEVHFFDINENYRRGLDWYREQMPESLPGDITIEKTPAYFVTDEVPKRVYEMSQSIKLIIILRDPTERAVSDYVQVRLKKLGVAPSFEKFITRGREEKDLRTSIGAIHIGVYIKHLRKWLNYFPLSQFHFVSMEEMTKNPATELQAVEKFLTLEPFMSEEFFYINETKRFPCLSRFIHGKKIKNSGCLSDSKGRTHPVIRDDIRKLLQDYYRPYNQELYKEAHRDFGWP